MQYVVAWHRAFWLYSCSGKLCSFEYTVNLANGLKCSLPGAVVMYAFALGVGKMPDTLPDPAYALLSGLNASAIGLMAFAGVKLSEAVITDRITRALVVSGAIGGMLYKSLWLVNDLDLMNLERGSHEHCCRYYPVLMTAAGVVAYLWDNEYLRRMLKKLQDVVRDCSVRRRYKHQDVESVDDWDASTLSEKPWILEKPLPELPPPAYTAIDRSSALSGEARRHAHIPQGHDVVPGKMQHKARQRDCEIPVLSRRVGSLILMSFGVSFVLVITLHAVLSNLPRLYELLSSLYLAGTILFGGGPVVLPLLREYTVSPGWVSPRDFLLGFSIFQALPGPGFNFAVYLGALAVAGTAYPSFVGAIVAFVAMYAPGILIVVGFLGIWRSMSKRKWFYSILRGVNAAAVGLVFTAVYKFWQIGRLTSEAQGGSPLGADPWLVGITTIAYVGSAWYSVNPPMAIVIGGALGIARYGIVRN